MRVEIHPPESIRFASDCVGFDGFRVVVIELPDEGEAGSGRRGHSCFRFACRPVQEKGRTLLTFEENPESVLMSRFRQSFRRTGLSFCLGAGLRAGLAPLRFTRAFLRRCCAGATSRPPAFTACPPALCD